MINNVSYFIILKFHLKGLLLKFASSFVKKLININYSTIFKNIIFYNHSTFIRNNNANQSDNKVNETFCIFIFLI